MFMYADGDHGFISLQSAIEGKFLNPFYPMLPPQYPAKFCISEAVYLWTVIGLSLHIKYVA